MGGVDDDREVRMDRCSSRVRLGAGPVFSGVSGDSVAAEGLGVRFLSTRAAKTSRSRYEVSSDLTLDGALSVTAHVLSAPGDPNGFDVD